MGEVPAIQGLSVNAISRPDLIYFRPVVTPAGDGSFIVRPGKPQFGRETLSVQTAAARTGISESTLMRLYRAGFVEGSQASPRKTRLFVDSLEQHFAATADPEFWTPDRVRRFNEAI